MNGRGTSREGGPHGGRAGRRRNEAGVCRAAGWLLLGLAACTGLGCQNLVEGKIDFKKWTTRPNPLEVIRNSTSGDERRDAIRSLNEPLAHGGTERQQLLVLDVLKYSALSDPQPVCRLAAFDVLRKFKDPQAVEILKEAYYKTTSFPPETGTMMRCLVLEALGDTHNPASVDLLVRVLREPPVEGPDVDRQQKLDERTAAARALGHFSDYQAATALVEVLRKEQDVALRSLAHQSLVQATGKDLPAEAQPWIDLLNSAPGEAPQRDLSIKEKLYRLAGWTEEQKGGQQGKGQEGKGQGP